jgi:TonB family protein
VKTTQCLSLLLLLTGGIVSLATAQIDSCKSAGPVLVDSSGKPIWLTTDALVKRATHCVPPTFPPLARQIRIEGPVLLDILVDSRGRVSCARLITGHPLFVTSAIQAAGQWTFQPMKQTGHSVSFYGHLRFRFSTERREDYNRCTDVP